MKRTFASRAKNIFVAVAMPFVFSNCALPPEPANPKTAIQQVETQDQKTRRLIGALSHRDAEIADSAADALKKAGKAAVPEIMRFLQHCEETTACNRAREVLGQIGVDENDLKPLLSILSKGTNPKERASVARLLGTLKMKASVEPLIEALKGPSWEVRGDTAIAIAQLGVDEEQFKVIAWSLSAGGTVDEKRGGAAALGAIGGKKAAAELVEALTNSKDQSVRTESARALWRIVETGGIGVEIVENITVSLLKAAKDASPDVKMAAFSALSVIGDARAIDILSESLQKDPVAKVRESAFEALAVVLGSVADSGKPGSPQLPQAKKVELAVGSLLGALDNSEASVRELAREYLSGSDDEEDIFKKISENKDAWKILAPALVKSLGSRSKSVRLKAAEILGRVQEKSALPALKKMKKDRDKEVKAAAEKAIKDITSPPAKNTEESPDVFVPSEELE